MLTYGIVRMFGGIWPSLGLDISCASTYFLEGFCFEYESRICKTMKQDKVTFVLWFCVALAILVILRPFHVYS